MIETIEILEAKRELVTGNWDCTATEALDKAIEALESLPMLRDDELRIVTNFLDCMTKVYRQRNSNWVVVRDILMSGTSTAGRTSCIKKCIELGIDPYGKTLEEKDGGVDG